MLRPRPISPLTLSAWGLIQRRSTCLSPGDAAQLPVQEESRVVDSPRAGGARSRSRRAAGGRWDARAEPEAAGEAWSPGAWGGRSSAEALRLVSFRLQTSLVWTGYVNKTQTFFPPKSPNS